MSYQTIINVSICGYFGEMRNPYRTYLAVFRCFFGKMSRLPVYLKTRLYHLIVHVFGKVQGLTSTRDPHHEYFKNIFECSHKPRHTNSTWFT